MSQNCSKHNETIKISIFHQFQHLPFPVSQPAQRELLELFSFLLLTRNTQHYYNPCTLGSANFLPFSENEIYLMFFPTIFIDCWMSTNVTIILRLRNILAKKLH